MTRLGILIAPLLALLIAGRHDARGEAIVTALGRLQPKDGIIRVAGPSRPGIVLARLLVEEGDRVVAGQPIAVLDSVAEHKARVERAKAELRNAQSELARLAPLALRGMLADQSRDAAELKVVVSKAELAAAEAALELDTVCAPVKGQVLQIHARRGERVGPEGIAEIAQNDFMYAVAEVYETDIGRVKVGQRASARSPALDPPLAGTIERVGLKIGKQDVLGTDPVARTDARVVEVLIRLDDSERAAALSNLQVEVSIHP